MRALTLLHRWLGVGFCLLFAMWFATGIVMHFVPFPALTEAERLAGLTVLDLTDIAHGPAEAVAASGISDVTRVRLLQRADGPVYLASGGSATKALRVADLGDGAVRSSQLARNIASEYARLRHFDSTNLDAAVLIDFDQWTVSERLNPHRPLYRVALGDDVGTELYVSSATGEIVQEATRRERAWNYVGSIAHWIYPTALRSRPAAWKLFVWWLSLLALIGALAGAVIGTARLGAEGSRFLSPYRGWQALHHWLGVISMLFVLTWMFSGWLSMDDGWLFSSGHPSDAERAAVAGVPSWNAVQPNEWRRVRAPTREVEWFAFAGQIYRRERIAIDTQRLSVIGSYADVGRPEREFLDGSDVNAVASRLSPTCKAPVVIDAGDDYVPTPMMPETPIFRFVCGGNWFDIDGASGVLLEKLDASRRAYRWLFGALHTLDFHALMTHPVLQTTLIAALCGCGFVFSLTGVVVAWHRLLSCFRSPRRR